MSDSTQRVIDNAKRLNEFATLRNPLTTAPQDIKPGDTFVYLVVARVNDDGQSCSAYRMSMHKFIEIMEHSKATDAERTKLWFRIKQWATLCLLNGGKLESKVARLIFDVCQLIKYV